jgi:hypothetical protein
MQGIFMTRKNPNWALQTGMSSTTTQLLSRGNMILTYLPAGQGDHVPQGKPEPHHRRLHRPAPQQD